MDYLTHQTTVSASTYSSEYPYQLSSNHPDYGTSTAIGESLADIFASATGTIKSRRSSANVRSSTMHRLRSHRKRFATAEAKATGGGGIAQLPTPPPGRRGASGSSGSGGLTSSRSMVDTTTAGQSLLSSGSETSMLTASADQDRQGGMLGTTQKASKRANRMYQSFLFRGKAASSATASSKAE